MQKSLSVFYRTALIVSATFTLFALNVSFSHAQTETVGTTPPPPKPPRSAVRAEVRDLHRGLSSTTVSATGIRTDARDLGHASTTMENVRRDERNLRVKQNMGLVTARLSAAADRLDQTIVRIESRMKKLSDAGADTSKEKVLIEDAKSLIIKARTNIASTSPLADGVVTSANPRSEFAKVRTSFIGIRDTLKKAQRNLVDAVVMLAKERRITREDSAPTSSTTQ